MEFTTKTFDCKDCSHKNVCKKIESAMGKCDDYERKHTYKDYSSIDNLFQPIFDWINFHYKGEGGLRFIVDYNSAKMYIEHGPFILSDKALGNLPCCCEAKIERNDGGAK